MPLIDFISRVDNQKALTQKQASSCLCFVYKQPIEKQRLKVFNSVCVVICHSFTYICTSWDPHLMGDFNRVASEHPLPPQIKSQSGCEKTLLQQQSGGRLEQTSRKCGLRPYTLKLQNQLSNTHVFKMG